MAFIKEYSEDDGDLMTIEEFDEAVDSGMFIPDDGDGYYSQGWVADTRYNVWAGCIPHGATHVVWFNK